SLTLSCTLLTALLTTTLPAVSLTMVSACKMGTPLLTKVPKVRVNLEIATLLITGPSTGIFSFTLSHTSRPNLVLVNNLNITKTTDKITSVQTRWSLTISLIPSTRRVKAGNCAPSNMPSKTDLKEGITLTIKIIRMPVATHNTATG